MFRNALLAIAAIAICAASAVADEVKLDSKIESVSLFKNGLAVVERVAQVPGPGVYRLDGDIWPVHGTYWVDADVPVETRVTLRDAETPPRNRPSFDLQRELVGKEVTIHFTDGTIPVASGTVTKLLRPIAADVITRNYQYQNPDYAGNNATFLLLTNAQNGLSYINVNTIAAIESKGAGPGGPPPTIHERRPVLLLTVGPEQKGPTTLHISYLTRGIAWAPSYRVRLLDNDVLVLQQQAAMRNELEDLKDADIRLISGYPNIECANVDSLLAPRQTWSNFFAQLSGNGQQGNMSGQFTNAIAMNQAADVTEMGRPHAAEAAGLPPDNVDVHYHSIGKHTLDLDDAVSIPVATGQSKYERVVEWTVPDLRDSNGRYENVQQAMPGVPDPSEIAWDAVQFKNPLSFAMTVAPAMIMDGGKFAGQQMSLWVNPGDLTTLRITRALSLSTHAVEQEDAPGNRPGVMIGGTSYQKVTVNGKLIMTNRRATDAKIIIRRQFTGELVNADENPDIKGLVQSGYSVNPRNEVDWTIILKAGEQKTLKYQYTLLIP